MHGTIVAAITFKVELKVLRIRYKSIGALSQVCDAQTQGIGVVERHSQRAFGKSCGRPTSCALAPNPGTRWPTPPSGRSSIGLQDSKVRPSTRRNALKRLPQPHRPTFLQIPKSDPGRTTRPCELGPCPLRSRLLDLGSTARFRAILVLIVSGAAAAGECAADRQLSASTTSRRCVPEGTARSAAMVCCAPMMFTWRAHSTAPSRLTLSLARGVAALQLVGG